MSAAEELCVIVVGAGHAGVEAAVAAAGSGCRVLLVTLDAQAIGRLSCNPSIGGLAKGQIVREIDALGGVMGGLADRSGIHFRLLNATKGPAVQSPRSQNDRELYEVEARQVVAQAGVEVVTGEAVDLIEENGRVAGVRLRDGSLLRGRAVVLTCGTFLGGVLHVGEESFVGGRLGEGSAQGMSQALAERGFRMGRLKTGTPPRLHRDSIDWARCEVQPSDSEPVLFSFAPQPLLTKRVDCALAYTNPAVHEVIDASLERSPMFSGRIVGQGPRYCPSIEDKICRFADRDSHQIFLEPEGLQSEVVYPNGISTSLPRDVQERFVRLIPGLEEARFLAHGYAVEYDYVDPTQCRRSLETVPVPGLFLAGQINGTTGYEEAAGQGFVAGVNAAALLRGEEALILGRHEAYIGVLIDDLVTRGVSEPYRMFTSLAEHRLLLKHQDADLRLLPVARRLGLRDPSLLDESERRRDRRDALRRELRRIRSAKGTLWDALRTPSWSWDEALERHESLAALAPDARDRDEIGVEARYEAYVRREEGAIARREVAESRRIPADFDYASVEAMSAEAREKLARIRPETVGQAGRVSGVKPADVSILMVHLARHRGQARG